MAERTKKREKRFFFLCSMRVNNSWLMGWNGAQRWLIAGVFANKCYDL